MSNLAYPITWPAIEEELGPFMKYCQGVVLNAGSGQRNVQLGQRDLNIDIGSDNQPDVIGDLHAIPLRDECVDTIVSIAVLEHTRYPWIVAQEFYRVLQPGGYGVIAVPFLQPQHACPNDYMRFTENGLVELMRYVGFDVIETAHTHHFGQTLAWLLWEYLQHNRPPKLVEPLWLLLIRQLSKGRLFKTDSPNTHNTHYVVVRKQGTVAAKPDYYLKALSASDPKTWFFPFLACPESNQPLHLREKLLVSEDGSSVYSFNNGIPELLPKHEVKAVRPAQKVSSSFQAIAPSSPVEHEAVPQLEQSRAFMKIISQEGFNVSFKTQFVETLRKANPEKIAVLATCEYDGIFKNGGVGTHYKTLSENLTKDGWYVILLLCFAEESYGGRSTLPAVNQIFSTAEIGQVLNLQPVHLNILSETVSTDRSDHQGFSCLFFIQALAKLMDTAQIYVEFHEMIGIGYRTVQAKQAGLLGENCLTAVTMHSGHEWVYDANGKYIIEDDPKWFWQVSHYEQYSFENADLVFYPSYSLKSKVESYGWKTSHANRMPYFVPLMKRDASEAATIQSEELSSM